MAQSKNKRKNGKRAGQRKRHTGMLRAQRFFGRSRVYTWESEWHGEGPRMATAQAKTIRGWEHLDQDIAEGVIHYPNNWMICCRALCRSADGVEWVETEIRSVRNVSLQSFTGLYRELREAVLQEVRKDHVVDMGWICETWLDDRLDSDQAWYLHDLGIYTPERAKVWREGDPEVRAELFEIEQKREAA